MMLNNRGVCVLFLATCLASPMPWSNPSLDYMTALSLARRSVEEAGFPCKFPHALDMPIADNTDPKPIVPSLSRSDDHVAKRSLSGASIAGANFAGTPMSTTRIASY